MSTITAQPPEFTSGPTQIPPQQQGPTTGPIYLYAFTLIAFLVCTVACCSVWRGVVIRRRRRELGLPELEEWGMGPPDAFGRRFKEEEPVDPPLMYEVYLEDGKAEGGRWYWGQEKGEVDDGVWSTKMPISTSVVPVADPPTTSSEPETDPYLGITILSSLAELSPHRWKLFRRLRTRRQSTPSSSSSPSSLDPPPPPSPRKLVASVLIAMPAPHHARNERQPSAATSDGTLVFEDEFPEVLFGVYEGAWAQQPTKTSLAPQLSNDVSSRV